MRRGRRLSPLWAGTMVVAAHAQPAVTVAEPPSAALATPPSLDLRLQLTPLSVNELPGVTVYGTPDPLRRSDRHLEALKAGLPCMGCERYKQDQPPGWMLFAQGFLPTEAPPPGPPEDRARLASQTGHCTPENPFGCMGGH